MAQLESLASRVAPTPEMVFAQKATAIVKAAGMNPRSIDLESFRKIAPLIFCRAYCAIYKENLITTVNENSSKGDLILNSQLVIDGLLTKTRNPALLEINGTDILQGNHRAIGIIVGVLFAEGQRLWLEKSSQVEAQQVTAKESAKNTSPVKPASENKPLEKTPEASGGQKPEETQGDDLLGDDDDALMSNPNFSDNEPLTDDEQLDAPRKSKKRRGKSKRAVESNTGNGVTERELDGLLNRITYLEDQLRKSKGTSNATRPHSAGPLRRSRSGKKSARRGGGAGSSRSRSPHERGTASNALLFSDESSDEGHKVESGDDNAAVRKSPRKQHQKKQSRIAKLIESNQKAMSNAVIDQAQTLDKKYRPSSAPSTRKVRHVSARLYSAKNTREVLEIVNPQQTAAAIAAVTPPKPKKPWDPEAPAPQYTYDLRSGRKVLLSQVEAEALQRKQQRYATTNILAGTEDDEYMGGGKKGPQEPVKPEWPGKSTSRSVEAWVKKFKILREEKLYHPPEMPLAKSFALYNSMEKLDVIISVEHCFNCHQHNITFRHDPAGYVSAADKFLRILSQLVYENYLCVRVGVTRFPAAITAKSVASDADSRIGAFEIQIAARRVNGDVSSEMLHSKLAFKGWPSKSVLKKRLQAYLNKLNLPSYASKLAAAANADSDDEDAVDDKKQQPLSAMLGEVEFCGVCADPYPVGGCQWIETPLANPSWSYSCLNPNDTVDGIPSVQWVFDTRNLANPNKFKIGREVRVNDVRYMGQHPERLPLLGSVRENLNNKTLTVRLKYTNEDVVVPIHSCVLVSEYTGRSVQYNADTMPTELEALLLLARTEKLIHWSVMNPTEDKKEGTKQFYLCRASFFTQVRKLCWSVEMALNGRGARVVHPLTNQKVELQQSYTEEVLEWVYNRYHEQANMSDLEKTVKAKAAAHAAANPVISKSDALYSTSSPAVMQQQQQPQHPVRAPSPGLAAPPATPVTVVPSVAPTPTPSVSAGGIAVERFTPATTPAKPEASPAPQKAAAAPVVSTAPTPTASVAPTIATAPSPAAPAVSSHENHSEHAKKPAAVEEPPHPTPAAAAPPVAPVQHHSIPAVPATADQMNSLRILMISSIATAQVGDDKSTGSQLSKMDIVELLSDSLHQLTEEHGYEPVENYKSSHLLLDPEYKVALEVKVFLTCLEQYGLRVVTKHEPNVEAMLGHFGQINASDKNVVEVKIDMFIEWLLSGSLNKTRKSTKDLTIIATSPNKSAHSAQVTPSAVSAPPDSVRSDVSMDSQLQFSTTPHTAVSTAPASVATVPVTTEPESPAVVPVSAAPTAIAALASVDPRQAPAAVSAAPAPHPATVVSNGSANDLADAEVLHINSARIAATPPVSTAEVPVQQPQAVRTVESESRNTIVAPDTARESVASTSSKQPVDTRTDAERAEAEAMQELKERAKLEYQSKDLVFGSIIIEGEALEHAHYDTVMANLTIEDRHWAASVCLARERGSKRRSFNLSWGDILVKQDSFREGNAYLSVVIADLSLAEQHPKLPVLHSTQLGVSPHSARIPLYKFMQPSFEIRSKVHIEPIIEGKAHPKGDVSIVIHGHAHEAKEARTSRIMSMKPQDLMKMKFEPLPVELDDDLLEESDEEDAGFEDDFLKSPGNKKNKGKSPQELKEEKEVASSLFPKASLYNLLSPASSTPALPPNTSGAATPAVAAPAAEEKEEEYNDAFDD